MTRLVDLSMPVHADMITFPRVPAPSLLVNESLRLHFEEPSGIPALFTDEAKVSQILRNFVSNALKYGAGKPVEVSVHRQNGVATLSVSDRGVGIAAEDESTNRNPAGAGHSIPSTAWWIVGTAVYQVGRHSCIHSKKRDASKPGAQTMLPPAASDDNSAPIRP